MPEERPFYEEVLDQVIHAPIDAAIGLARNLSGVVTGGKERVEDTVKVATEVARSVYGAVIDRVTELVSEVDSETSRSKDDEHSRESDEKDEALDAKSGTESNGITDSNDGIVALPISDYDELPTADLVACLSQLNRDDRAAIRSYEIQHRNRRTVLGRINQLDEQTNG